MLLILREEFTGDFFSGCSIRWVFLEPVAADRTSGCALGVVKGGNGLSISFSSYLLLLVSRTLKTERTTLILGLGEGKVLLMGPDLQFLNFGSVLKPTLKSYCL